MIPGIWLQKENCQKNPIYIETCGKIYHLHMIIHIIITFYKYLYNAYILISYEFA